MAMTLIAEPQRKVSHSSDAPSEEILSLPQDTLKVLNINKLRLKPAHTELLFAPNPKNLS